MKYQGSCHCGAISFTFKGPEITEGVRCDCSLCVRRGAVMTTFTIAPEDIDIAKSANTLSTYQFKSKTAKHHFCQQCGVYPFHQTLIKPGHYRINIGCVEQVRSLDLPIKRIDGKNK